MKTRCINFMRRNKNIVRIVLITGLILLVPLIAMRFSDEVNWSLADFVIIGTLLIGTGLIYELASRRLESAKHRAVLGFILLVVMLLIWADLAVGVFNIPGISGS